MRDIGIREKDQKYVLSKTLGVRGKEEGIIDAVDGKDLRKRLRSAQNEVDEQERLTLGKDEHYASKYWSYLNDNRKMIRRLMVADGREKRKIAKVLHQLFGIDEQHNEGSKEHLYEGKQYYSFN